jgi:hypothetical protein
LTRYSGYLETVQYLLTNLRKISPEKYKDVIRKIDSRVIDDYRKISLHWQKALNPTLSSVQDKVYDTYLKANKQQSGIMSYSEMTALLVVWEKIKLRTGNDAITSDRIQNRNSRTVQD